MMNIIDTHLHLFDVQRGDYGWLKSCNSPFWPDKEKINKNWSETDLTLTVPNQIVGFVHIEAGFDNKMPWREIAWLESTVSLPFRSIGCVDLTQTPVVFADQLIKLRQYTSVVGVRHILDEEAANLLRNPRVMDNLRTIAESNLIFEAQFSGSDTDAIDALTSVSVQIPHLQIALNHAGFPPQDNSGIWMGNLNRLASIHNVWVKASGWEMTNRRYASNAIEQRIGELVSLFGEDRVMLASNFPLCLFRSTYENLWSDYLDMPLSNGVLEKLCFRNAQQFYRFDPLP